MRPRLVLARTTHRLQSALALRDCDTAYRTRHYPYSIVDARTR